MTAFRLENIRRNKEFCDRAGRTQITTVEGKSYEVWSDFIERCTFAQDEDGEFKAISSNGYIHNDLTVRKAIANHFGHKSFKRS